MPSATFVITSRVLRPCRIYDVELVPIQLQVLCQTIDSSIANVASVDESQQPKAKEPWNDVQVELASNPSVKGMIDVRNLLSFELGILKSSVLVLFVFEIQCFRTGAFSFHPVRHKYILDQVSYGDLWL